MRVSADALQEDIEGPSIEAVRDAEIVTLEEAANTDKTPHPAAETIHDFGVDIAAKQSAKSSIRYVRGIKPLVVWLDECRDIGDPLEASAADVSDYLKWLANTKWSRNSRESRFSACQRFYRWAETDGPLAENLTEDESINDYTLDGGALEESRGGITTEAHKWVTRDKVVQLWQEDNITSPRLRDELIIKLMWYTTCRPGAVAEMRLEPEDSPGDDPTYLDRERARINVPNLKRGDTQDERRWVYYPRDRIEPLLEQWIGGRRQTLGPYYKDSEYLFLTHQKPQMRPSHISRKVKQAAENAGIQKVAGYDAHGNPRWMVTGKTIRHSAITYLANECPDVPLQFVQQQAGHSKIETTMGYVHKHEQSRRQALNQAWK